jgi:hypothetical protein
MLVEIHNQQGAEEVLEVDSSLAINHQDFLSVSLSGLLYVI